MTVKVLSEHSEVAFNLVRDLLRYPSFPKGRFDKLREDQIAEIESMDQDPTRVARRLFYEAAYKGQLDPTQVAESAKLTKEVEALEKAEVVVNKMLVVTETGPKSAETFILKRGNRETPGEKVARWD